MIDQLRHTDVEIHPTAIVHPKAKLGVGVKVGPYSYIGPDVEIGDYTQLLFNVYVDRYVKIGRNNLIYNGAVIGTPPQDKSYKGEETWVIIGDNNVIREYVTVHRATGEGEVTAIGNNNLIMAYSHIAHNCKLGSNIIISNSTGLSGHVVIDDYAVIGGMVGVHQFVRIGSFVMVGGYSKVSQDVPPYLLVFGNPAKVYNINRVGLVRNGFTREQIEEVKSLFKLLYLENGTWKEKLERLAKLAESSQIAKNLYQFISRPSKRGILRKISLESPS